MHSFIKIFIVFLFSSMAVRADSYTVNFAFADSNVFIQSLNSPSYSLAYLLSNQNTEDLAEMYGLFGPDQCTNSLTPSGCDQVSFSHSDNSITMSNVSSEDDSSLASIFNQILFKTNNMMSNQNAFTVKESNSGGQCVAKSVTNHQPGQLSFYIAQDITFYVSGSSESTTCPNVILGMQQVAANVEKVWRQEAITSEIEDDADEVILGGDCSSSDASSCQKKTGTTGKTIKEAVKETQDTVAAIKCSGNIWWMSQAVSASGNGYNQQITFYPYQAPDWLGLRNQYFNIGIQCSNNYTMFFTHADIDGGNDNDLDPNQGCSTDHNTFNVVFVKTVQGGYN